MQIDLIRDFVSRRIWAVVGFSAHPSKFGHRIYFDLKQAGYRVYAVNRRGGTLSGEPVYSSVEDLPPCVDVVNLVVPPAQGILVVRECLRAGLKRIWAQPGAGSREILDFCRSHQMEVVSDACAMVEKRVFRDAPREVDRC